MTLYEGCVFQIHLVMRGDTPKLSWNFVEYSCWTGEVPISLNYSHPYYNITFFISFMCLLLYIKDDV